MNPASKRPSFFYQLFSLPLGCLFSLSPWVLLVILAVGHGGQGKLRMVGIAFREAASA